MNAELRNQQPLNRPEHLAAASGALSAAHLLLEAALLALALCDDALEQCEVELDQDWWEQRQCALQPA